MNTETKIIVIKDEKPSFTKGIPFKFWIDNEIEIIDENICNDYAKNYSKISKNNDNII